MSKANRARPGRQTEVSQGKESDAYVLIEDQASLDQVWEALSATRRFGFDTEFVMEDVYHRDLCLVQIATDESVFIIDPQYEAELTPLWEFVADPDYEIIVHSGKEDLGWVMACLDTTPTNVFDVQIAAGFLDREYPLNLGKLVQRTIGKNLHKSQTLTDWRKRPLRENQLRYAAEDVCFLLPVHQALVENLKAKRRLSWAREEMTKLEARELYTKESGAAVTPKIKGIGNLGDAERFIAEQIAQWRDDVARKMNRPARLILKDYLIAEIARHRLQAPDAIGGLRGVSLSRKLLSDLSRHLEGVIKDSSNKKYKRSRKPAGPTLRQNVLIELCDAVMRSECDRRGIAAGLVYTKRMLTEFVENETSGKDMKGTAPVVELAMGWRDQVAGKLLRDILAGRRSVAVNGNKRGGALTMAANKAPS